MGNPVVHFEVMGKDAKALQSFYKQAFDWQFEPPVAGVNVPNYSLVHPQNGSTKGGIDGINGGIGDSPEGYAGHVTFYVAVPDIKAALGKIETLGGKRLMGPDVVPGGGPTIAMFADPEEHVIGLVQI
ncbi:MAG TPA: VOC family protein [Candidatus Tumulicola sp.]|nr:VOC family protein [Candidatus Tumulicola sp.]